MSRLYDSIEPAVIEEGMLLQAVEEQGPKYEAGEIVKKEGIDFDYVLHLRLDFKNILKIDNLWCFIKLTKLQLDNNVIEKIEGLDQLINLVWLDLSFNNIEEIEGLDNLTKLTDLSLYNNRISTIANMDTLMDLEVLSLGNNDINDLRMILYLRKFKKLKMINLAGNPFCEMEDYKTTVVVYLNWVEYVDYALVKEEFRENALRKMQTSLDALVESEMKIQQKEEEQRLMREEYKKDMEAYVESFKDDLLYISLYADDVEGRKLNDMPGIADEMIYFKSKILAVSNQIFNFGTVEHIRIKDEVDTFWQCVEDAKAENKELSTKAFNEFIEYKDKTFENLTFVTEMSEYESKMAEFRKKLEELHDKQLTYEMQLVDQLEDVIKEFEHNLRDLVSAFTEGFQGLLANCRDLESQHHEKVMEVALINVETAHKNEVEDVSEDLRNLFMDKDTLVNAVTTSHEAHLLKIDHEEDKMSQRIKLWIKNLLKRIHDEEEVQRNRDRIIEITNMIDHLREAIDNLEGTVG
ncbi:dynein regulatory complex subunit 3-like [Octopus sinensis]|uniref:Dynein regulatory complex subunit 3 n=1 Tax=Octopus sinensis TaxID=2607531 RepID=A0A6P7U3R0_9MOLL|nr:dynein regulatory complex subunit 3-like [Octopus sinensis]